MDVVAHYSPPCALLSPIHASSYQSRHLAQREERRRSLPSIETSQSALSMSNNNNEVPSSVTTHQTVKTSLQDAPIPISTTFNRAVEISLMEPIGSMSISPANRDVVLAARKGLFILDLENPYDQPRFLPHLTTWVPADVQWNPHPARANWVASTSNNKLLVWNLDRPGAYRAGPIFSMPVASSSNPGSSPTSPHNMGATPSTNLTGTLPHTPYYAESVTATVSQSSSISHILNAHTRAITDINWSPFHPEILASCGIDTWMWAWDLREPSRPKQGYSAWNAAMTQVKWNRASPHRLATSCDNKVLIWDDRKGALPLATIEAAQSRIYGIDWSRDTSLGLSRLVTCSLDGSVKWWDLDSPAAQQAIGERRLVTEEETMIETHTPVWRARHLPFGNGVMTLPQRGDTSLCMWAKDKPDEPVHRFEGHRDTVKEYLIRTQGGSNRERDDRKFQLITWSKDQTLRLWPISEEMMKAVGHKRGDPIRVLQTRIGAENITYRIPPEPKFEEIASMPLLTSPDGLLKNSPSSNSVSLLPPTEITRSLFSGNLKTSDRSTSRLGGVGNGNGGMGPVSGSPHNSTGARSTGRKFGLSGSHGHERQYSGSLGDHWQKTSNSSHLTINKGKRCAAATPAGRMTLEAPKDGQLGSSQERIRREARMEEKTKQKRRQKELASGQVTRKNYMTRGNGGQISQGGYLTGGNLNKASTGRGAALDAIGWIAGVRMGDEEVSIGGSSSSNALERQEGKGNHTNEKVEEETVPRDAGQILGEEIKSVSRNVSGAAFEKIDVSTKLCTVTCYGPWAGRNVACFLRITFTFPPTYPFKAPRFELEHNASVSLKTRAFLLRKLSSIITEATQKHPPEPSMEGCLRFLLGETLDDETDGDLTDQDGFWLPGDETDEEEEKRLPLLKLPPRQSGASFGANGQLVTFHPGAKVSTMAGTPSAAMAIDLSSTPGGASTETGNRSSREGENRFLHSYTALSGAMSSLVRLAKEGMAVQDLDVVQLMADQNQNFFAKRIIRQQQQQRAEIRTPTSSSRKPTSKVRDRSLAIQDRLGYIKTSTSRTSSGSRSARRARSASPMPVGDYRATGKALRPDQSAFERGRITTKLHSQVRIWKLNRIISGNSSNLSAPPLVRRRSSTLPSTPTTLTPRAEKDSFNILSLAVPTSLDQNEVHQQGTSNLQSRATAWTQSNGASTASRGNTTNLSNRLPADNADGEESDSSSDDQYGESDSDEEPNAASLLRASERDAMNPIVEQVFDTIIWTIPFGFLYLMMDIMIQQQYGVKDISFLGEVGRLLNPIPILTAFVYFTAIRPNANRVLLQLLMFFISTMCGASFLYIYARSPMEIVVRRVPPLGTLWMYSLVRLDLSGVLLSLALIWGFTIYHDLPVLS